MKIYSLISFLLIATHIYAQCTAEECGPPPMMPAYLCGDGETVAGPGDCIQNATTGQCYWEIVTCPSVTYTGYMRSIWSSFCMDACSNYHLEKEDGSYLSNITDLDGIETLSYYADRYVYLDGEEVWCVECGAVDVNEIQISSDCPDTEVECFINPCQFESCYAYSDAQCMTNYCGGCHADFYNANGQLITDCGSAPSCPGPNPAGCFQNGCPDGQECINDWENNCTSSVCSCDEAVGQWMCTDDCNGGTCFEDVAEGCGMSSSCDDCTEAGCFWQPTDDGICGDECLIEDLECYGSGSWWTAECPDGGECVDLSGIFFGVCAMYLGVGFANGSCQHISGCGWVVDGIDYSYASFETMDQCETVCGGGDMSCDEITSIYDILHSGEYTNCEYDNDCIAVWGHCDVGLGGCHYSVNEENYPEDEIDDLVDMWLEGDCMQWVCDCSTEPYAQCIDESCTSAYCMGENPAGCNQTGCDEGYECVVMPNECVPSTCYCDGFYGNWYCTEDCGGGTCVETALSGDLNGDGEINVVDIVIVVELILNSEFDPSGDVNGDNLLNVVDIVMLVNIILED